MKKRQQTQKKCSAQEIRQSQINKRANRKKKKSLYRSSIYNKHVVFFMTLCDALVISLFLILYSATLEQAFCSISNQMVSKRKKEIKSGRKTCDIRSYFAYNLVTFLFVLGNWNLPRLRAWHEAHSFESFFSSDFALRWERKKMWREQQRILCLFVIIPIVGFVSPKFVPNNQMRQLYAQIYILFNC